MVALPNGPFNAGNYQPSEGGGGSVLPDGIYDVAMSKSVMKPTRSNDGEFLECTLNIISGEYVGKRVISRFNVKNPNAEAESIAMSELTSMSIVIGVPYWQDSQQLHGRPFKVKVEKEERSDRPGSFNNRVTAYLDAWGNPPNPANSGQPQGNGYPTQPQQQPPAQPPQGQPQGGQQFPNQAPNVNPAPPQGFPNTAPQGAPYGQGNPNMPGAPDPATYGAPGTGQFPPQGQGQPMTPQGAPQGMQPNQWPGNPQGQQQPPQGQYQQPPQGMQPPQNAPVAGPGNSQPPQGNPGYGYAPGGAAPGAAPPWAS